MRWTKKLNEKIKTGIRSWLDLNGASAVTIRIEETLDFELNAIRNRIWYRGDSNELMQLYGSLNEYADKYKFWACKSSPGQDIRKIHTGLPGLVVKILSQIVLADMNDFEFKSAHQEQIWKEISKDNSFLDKLNKYLKEILVIGDGAFKISYDTSVSQYPIIEFYAGDRVEFVYERGRLKEIVFKTPYVENKHQYILYETYGYGYITYELCKGKNIVPLNTIEATANLQDVSFNPDLMLAVNCMRGESSKFEGRGQSLFDGKIDSFDAYDEAWSQWMDALRAGRTNTYIPESMIPKDEKGGDLLKPNPFDNRFIAVEDAMQQDSPNKIQHEQSEIQHESYLASYITALDQCLQGIISPSTLGIDVKKLDNAEAQREKEKATLYTRNDIVELLQHILPDVIGVAINAYNTYLCRPLEVVEVTIPFGEYANPSFESQVETVGKGRTQGIMSIEASVDELYGDGKDKDWKAEEIKRLKIEQGLMEIEEPSVIDEGVDGINV